jgi:hypothetical protein
MFTPICLMMTRSSCRHPSSHLPLLLSPKVSFCFNTTATTTQFATITSIRIEREPDSKELSSLLPSSHRPTSVIFEGLLFFSIPSSSSRGIQDNLETTIITRSGRKSPRQHSNFSAPSNPLFIITNSTTYYFPRPRLTTIYQQHNDSAYQSPSFIPLLRQEGHLIPNVQTHCEYICLCFFRVVYRLFRTLAWFLAEKFVQYLLQLYVCMYGQSRS